MSINFVEIDLASIRHNYKILKQCAGPLIKVMAIIKSDAYGHGMVHVAKSLAKEGCQLFGVFELDEAIELRKNGVDSTILVLMGIRPENAADTVRYGITPALFQTDIAGKLSEEAVKQKKTVSVHLKVDTGMTRLGIYPNEVESFLKQISKLEGINVEGVFSHLANADYDDDHSIDFTQTQVSKLKQLVDMPNLPKEIHISNSAGIIKKVISGATIARAGISLYGSLPNTNWPNNLGLKSAMRFVSKIISIKTVKPNTPVSYGGTYVTTGNTKIATIPVGYDDGYSRLLSNQGYVLVKGIKAPVIGRVCMNLSMIDVTDIPSVSVDDEVVLLGSQGNEKITADEIAKLIGSISYEVYCMIGKANRKIYLN